jgi:putative phosphoribosyl transferase
MDQATERTWPRFADRRDAGRHLAPLLASYADRQDVVVLALPRGGVPVAYELATTLHLPLDVFEVRKLGVPGHEELAMGAIGSGGICHVMPEVIAALRISRAQLAATIEIERRELERREKVYRDSRPRPKISGKTIILVDDGLATGSTMGVAIAALRERHPAKIVVAVPVAPPETCDALRTEADVVVCATSPDPFHGVGFWYADFTQVGDEEVRTLLNETVAKRSADDMIEVS